MIPLEDARWRLAILWFPGGGLLILVLVAQMLGGAYGPEVQRAFGWALPNILPTLALMVSVFAADALRPVSESTTVVRKNFTNLTVGLSVFYLLLLSLAILAFPVFGGGTQEDSQIEARLSLMEQSNVFLAPVQSIVVLAIGTLFFLKEEERK